LAKEKDLVFIVSGGRTGTQFLGDRISDAIPACFSEHEPDVIVPDNPRTFKRAIGFGLWKSIFGKIVGRSGIRTIGTLRLKGRISESQARKRLEAARNHYHNSIQQDLIIESNGQWNYACEELAQIWPHAKLAIIIRDPRSWIRSWINKGTRWHWYDSARWLPPGRLTPVSVRDNYWSSRWKEMDTFGRLAWEWQFTYSRLVAHAEKNPNARIFRFEDLFSQADGSAMQDLIAFCAQHRNRDYQVKLPSNFTNRAQNVSTGPEPEWIEWSDARARLLHEACGQLMRSYGYGLEAAWIRKLRSSK
jgi:hypothetical protein